MGPLIPGFFSVVNTTRSVVGRTCMWGTAQRSPYREATEEPYIQGAD